MASHAAFGDAAAPIDARTASTNVRRIEVSTMYSSPLRRPVLQRCGEG
jgi:hypothetical protein